MLSENTSTEEPSTEAPAPIDSRVAAQQFLDRIQAEEEYRARWQRIWQRILLLGGIVLLAVGLPILYLRMNGTLFLPGPRHHSQASIVSQKNAKSDEKVLFANAVPSLTPAQIAHNKQVAQDLQSYVQQGERLTTPDETIAMNALTSVTGANFKSNAIAFRTIQGVVLPHYSALLTNLASMHPRTPEVQSIHRVLLKSSRLKMMAFQHILEGLRETDNDQLWQYGVHAELDQSTQFAQDYHTQITDLAAAQGVKLQ